MKTDYEMIKRALSFAREVHSGQVDKAGADYIPHPITVALLCDDPMEKVVALLHDTMEDHGDMVSYEILLELFGKEVAEAVQLLTNDGSKGTYLDYIRFIKSSGNRLAIEVKKADLVTNMDLSRLETVSERDRKRVEQRYRPALDILESAE